MNIAVRYYSRSGNTKGVAEAIAKGVGVEAISVDSEDSKINEDVDVLFVGGALYAYGLDKHLKTYLSELDGSKVKKAVVFSTSWISKHSIDLIKKGLSEKNIPVEEEYFYSKSAPTDAVLKEAEEFGKKMAV
ncbi:MAG: flavodoxin [Clostridia bacterium]|nr:flavodoxin [Clostridia bacterium]